MSRLRNNHEDLLEKGELIEDVSLSNVRDTITSVSTATNAGPARDLAGTQTDNFKWTRQQGELKSQFEPSDGTAGSKWPTTWIHTLLSGLKRFRNVVFISHSPQVLLPRNPIVRTCKPTIQFCPSG
jgi:hypothetical protein